MRQRMVLPELARSPRISTGRVGENAGPSGVAWETSHKECAVSLLLRNSTPVILARRAPPQRHWHGNRSGASCGRPPFPEPVVSGSAGESHPQQSPQSVIRGGLQQTSVPQIPTDPRRGQTRAIANRSRCTGFDRRCRQSPTGVRADPRTRPRWSSECAPTNRIRAGCRRYNMVAPQSSDHRPDGWQGQGFEQPCRAAVHRIPKHLSRLA